ncbi:MAG: hypothetical protein WD648_11125 [Planctomycetaceae bacterium]
MARRSAPLRNHLNRSLSAERIVRRVRKLTPATKLPPPPARPSEGNGRDVHELSTSILAEKAARASEDNGCIVFSEASLERELQSIHTTEVNPCVEEWADLYSQVGNRSRYLWKWATRGAELTTLPCVPSEWRQHVRDTKVLSIMICVLLDDAADAQKNQAFMEILLDVAQRKVMPASADLSEADRHYASITLDLCNAYERRIREYPCFEVYKDLLDYDLMQFVNTMRYSCLLNRHRYLLNLAEHEIYFPHNMHMMSFATLDLMCTPDFDMRELGRLREAVWHGQCMGRIGNLLSTWRRELAQGDFTSDVFARAVAEGDLSSEQLTVENQQQIEETIRNGGHEEFFFRRWQFHRERFLCMAALIKAVDLRKSLEGHEQFFCMHLASRGLI